MKQLTNVIIALLLSALLLGCAEETPEQEAKPRLVRAIKIGEVQLDYAWVPGTAIATRSLELSFRIGGRMIERPVFVGDKLKKGDLVARLDPVDYEIDLRNTQGQLENVKANLRAAQAEYDRVLNIQKKDSGAVSQMRINRTREERDQALGNIKSLEAAVENAKVRLQRTELRAPFDGTVVAKYAQQFEDVKAKQPIVRIVDNSRIDFVVNLPEQDISLLSDITNIRVKFDAFPDREIPAEIKEVGTEASLTTRTFPVRLIMDQPENIEILPGMAGKATADYAPGMQESNIVVPMAATFTEERGSKKALEGRPDASLPPAKRPTYVWVIDQETMTVKQRQVKTGALRAAGVKIEEGLEPGEWIVTAGASYLDTGQRVRLIQAPGEGKP